MLFVQEFQIILKRILLARKIAAGRQNFRIANTFFEKKKTKKKHEVKMDVGIAGLEIHCSSGSRTDFSDFLYISRQ